MNPLLEGPGTVVAVEVLVELVGVALELNLVLVVVKEQRADVGEAVRKDECPNDHADSGHKALEGRLRDDIAVADRGHGGERPVHRGNVLFQVVTSPDRQADVREVLGEPRLLRGVVWLDPRQEKEDHAKPVRREDDNEAKFGDHDGAMLDLVPLLSLPFQFVSKLVGVQVGIGNPVGALCLSHKPPKPEDPHQFEELEELDHPKGLAGHD